MKCHLGIYFKIDDRSFALSLVCTKRKFLKKLFLFLILRKLEGKSLVCRDGGLEDILPPPTGEGVRRLLSRPLPAPKKLSGIGVLLSQMQLMCKQFKIELRKKKVRPY